MKYRPEVDGLRTVAVLPVIFYHAGIGPFQGGFAGVDIFFVISGYLITSLIIGDIEAGRFSIASFYERRARRILPALFVVLTVSSLLAWRFLYPLELNEYAQSAVATVLFSSNIFFWLKSDYFSTAAELKPLLHTWSLAVEEQYYLFFPPLMVLIWKGKDKFKRCFAVLSAITVVSLAMMLIVGTNWANAGFYLLPFRAWELLIGALCAVALTRWNIPANPFAALVGLLLVVAALLLANDAGWPSWQTMFPTVGTALVILFAARGAGVGRLLASRPMVACGLISYSLYLWHQPLLAFLRLRLPDEPTDALKLTVILIAVVLSALTWRFVEQPFRNRRDGAFVIRAQPMATVMICSAALVLVIGIVTDIRDGWAGRVAPSGLTFSQIERDLAGARIAAPPCDIDLSFRQPPKAPLPECVFPASSSAPVGRALLLGDSHATMLTDALVKRLTDAGYQTSVATFGGCIPFAGYRTAERNCDAANTAMQDHVAASDYDLIVLAFRSQPLFNGETSILSGDGQEKTSDISGYISDLIRDGLSRLTASGARVVVFEPVPEMSRQVGHLARNYFAFEKKYQDLTFATPLQSYLDRAGTSLDLLREMQGSGLELIPTSRILCDDEIGQCAGIEAGVALYTDDNHLSVFGVEKLMSGLDAEILPK